MNDFGVLTESGTVRFERVLPGPIERVWAYLTESEKRGKWLASGAMELRVGGRVELNFHHAGLSPHQEPVPARFQHENCASTLGHVTRCEPPRLLSYTWGETGGRESEVTFELTPRAQDVVMVLTHRRLANREEVVSVSGGWHAHVDVLIDVLNGREPKPFWSAYTVIDAQYEQRTPQ